MAELVTRAPVGRRWLAGAAILAGGAASSLALAAWFPLPPADALHGTVVVLPLSIALLAIAELVRPGPAAPSPRTLAVEASLLVCWIAGALARPALGLTSSERALVVALFLSIGAHLTRRLLALSAELPASPAEAGRTRGVSWRLFLYALALYALSMPWSTAQRPPDGDEPWYLLTAHSLAQDLDTDLADDYRDHESRRFSSRDLEPQPGDPRGPQGQIYSRHDPLLPLLLAPFFAVAGKHGALFAMALFAAATVAIWWQLAERAWPERPKARLAQWAVLALLPPWLVYSYQIWVEVPAALLVTLALLALDRLRRAPTPTAWAQLAIAVLGLPALKLRFALLSASLLAVALLALPRARKRLLALGAVGAVFGSAFLLHNLSRFGNALRIHDWGELLLYRHSAVSYVAHLLGLWFDVGFGLFAAAPIWMLSIPGAALAVRATEASTRRRVRELGLVCLALAGPYLLLVASRQEWYGGWSPPFRYPLAMLPVLGLLAVPAWGALRYPRARLWVSVLGLATLVLAIVMVAEPGLAYNFANGRSRLLDVWSEKIGLDLAPFVPSSVRLRAATWWVPLLATVGMLLAWPRPSTAESRADEERPTRGAAILGGALVLLGLALALPVLAASGDTHRIDLESPHVSKTAGQPDPDPWMLDRRRFPEAWVLPEGGRATAPVRAGGDLVELRVDARAIFNHPGQLRLDLACGDRLLARLRFDAHDVWQELAAGPVPWQRGCPLVASVPADGKRPRGVVNGIAIDRIELRWR